VRVERFEDLIAWQRARALTGEIYRATHRGALARDRALAQQVERASVSIMANLAEGFERGGRAEFHHFVSTAKASCAEVRSHLYVALDAGYLDEPEFQALRGSAEELARVLGGLRAALQRQRDAQRSRTLHEELGDYQLAQS
jgi:four helix bundle protein